MYGIRHPIRKNELCHGVTLAMKWEFTQCSLQAYQHEIQTSPTMEYFTTSMLPDYKHAQWVDILMTVKLSATVVTTNYLLNKLIRKIYHPVSPHIDSYIGSSYCKTCWLTRHGVLNCADHQSSSNLMSLGNLKFHDVLVSGTLRTPISWEENYPHYQTFWKWSTLAP